MTGPVLSFAEMAAIRSRALDGAEPVAHAAVRLGLNPQTLYGRLRAVGLSPGQFHGTWGVVSPPARRYLEVFDEHLARPDLERSTRVNGFLDGMARLCA